MNGYFRGHNGLNQRWRLSSIASKSMAKPRNKTGSCRPARCVQGMGGFGRMDQNVGAYRISMRSNKWWWPFFAFLADDALQNSWLLHRMSPANEGIS
ncbi:PiggyBac transposable element-derived protein 3 [Elysia marginata]|uniref:PiggyBac transposable element-derived protein 3 n=1 Tax=Elysia marginata TaxID=1093978 RepID=A0AAV4G8M6_9GAST|nr:PiggyBac transposable element-derived protein 3 [Elysia marginata]